MYRFRKVRFYLIFSISIFTSNSAYSGFLDDLKREASKILKTVEKEVEKTHKQPADRVDDERSQSVDYSRNPVHEVQNLLYKLGYDVGPVDGVLRTKTARAIEAFERDHNMHVDGRITDSLLIALRKAHNLAQAGESSSKSSDGKQPEKVEQEIDKTLEKTADKSEGERTQPQKAEAVSVYEVQDRLNRLGYDAGPVDGVLRTKTARAIEAFERDHNMHIDGEITERLVNALRKAHNLAQAGDSSSKSSDGKQPVTTPQQNFQTSGNFDNKSVAVSGDAESIKGRWLGYYQKNRIDTFFWLDVRLAGDRIEAEIEAEFPPLALAGEYDPVGHTFSLDPTHWVHGPPPGNPQFISLKGHYVTEHDVIYGNLSNVQGSPSFVAGRDIRPEAPAENTGGLLFKITADRKKNAKALSLDDCRRYAEWLASGSQVRFGGRTIDSAILNQNSMRNVLGRDMYQWQEEDCNKLRIIAGACRRILASSYDLGDKNLVLKIRNPRPLNLSKKNGRAIWHVAKVFLKQDTVQNLQSLKIRLDEGIIALGAGRSDGTAQEFEGWEKIVKKIKKGSGAFQIPGLENSNGITGIWRGRYVCGAAEYFMRLILKRDGAALTGVLEFGPGLKSRIERGAFTVTGEVGEKGEELKLSPKEWIYQPRVLGGAIQPFGLQGRFNVEEDTIDGQLLGSEKCNKFNARRLIIPDKPKNPDGLLFKIIDQGRDTLTEADCVKYAHWFASGEEEKIGRHHLNTLIKDFDGMRSVLGKDFYQFDEQDLRKLGHLSQRCWTMIKESMDLQHIELSRKVKRQLPSPLEGPKFHLGHRWIIAEQLIYANDDAHMFATRQLRDFQELPDKLESLKVVDQAIETVEKSREEFEYMEEKGKVEHKANLSAFRLQLEERVAQSIIARFGEFSQTFAGLKELEGFNRRKKEEFLKSDATHWAQKLDVAFRQEAGVRANKLLTDALAAKMQALSTLSDATYERLDEFKAMDKEISEIMQFADRHNVPKSPALELSYQNYKDTYAKAYDDMINRSSDDLVQWIEEHPPEEKALEELKVFSLDTFGVKWSLIPDSFADIRNAINVEIKAYKEITVEQAKKQLALLEAKQQKSIEKSKSRTKKPEAEISKIDPGLVKKATLQVLDKERDLYYTNADEFYKLEKNFKITDIPADPFDYLHEKRKKSLSAAEPELARAVAKKDSNYDRILVRYLSVPGDTDTATWKALMRQITEKDSAPDRERYIRTKNYYYQRKLLEFYQKQMEQGNSIDFAGFSLEPSEEGIRMACAKARKKPGVEISQRDDVSKRKCVRKSFGVYICEYEKNEKGGIYVMENKFILTGSGWESPTEKKRWGIKKALSKVRGIIAGLEYKCGRERSTLSVTPDFGSCNQLKMEKLGKRNLKEKLSKWREAHIKQKLN